MKEKEKMRFYPPPTPLKGCKSKKCVFMITLMIVYELLTLKVINTQAMLFWGQKLRVFVSYANILLTVDPKIQYFDFLYIFLICRKGTWR